MGRKMNSFFFSRLKKDFHYEKGRTSTKQIEKTYLATIVH